ncbi:MAG: NIPSNAP family protein [Bacteroidales bacterium]|nr:NIPSNAP family protein [Bacteroidales bacterium]MDT8432812.1 NIPSNAP family protein [Bacteroidales bacterium]
MNKPVKMLCTLAILLMIFASAEAAPGGEYYQLRMYTIENASQESAMDQYLQNAYIPALKRVGISDIGVFKTIEGKNEGQQLIVVFIPFSSMKQLEKVSGKLEKDSEFHLAAKDFIEAPYDKPPYQRLETTLMKAFSATPKYHRPELASPASERVYELRSYQSATEELHRRKVKMFDEGESELFIQLGFEPMFFSKVIAGADMPNLVYMTCHENEEAQAANWASFRDHPEWIRMKAIDEYQHTVSQSDKWLLYPTEYSDL